DAGGPVLQVGQDRRVRRADVGVGVQGAVVPAATTPLGTAAPHIRRQAGNTGRRQALDVARRVKRLDGDAVVRRRLQSPFRDVPELATQLAQYPGDQLLPLLVA